MQSDTNKIDMIKKDIDATKNIMMENIELIIDRGDQLETLTEKTTILEKNSKRFSVQSRILHNRLWWKNVKVLVALFLTFGVLLGLFIYVIIKK
jgi:vesicle-associated membrane protein 7